MLRRIALTLQFPLKTCVIPRFLPPALILPRRHLSASGIIKLVEHELESGQCDFATKQSLEAACTDLKSHLKDREDLDQFVQDLNNEKDMLELARLDIEELKQNIEHVIDSLTNLLIPCTDYDAENAVLEECSAIPELCSFEPTILANPHSCFYHLTINDHVFIVG